MAIFYLKSSCLYIIGVLFIFGLPQSRTIPECFFIAQPNGNAFNLSPHFENELLTLLPTYLEAYKRQKRAVTPIAAIDEIATENDCLGSYTTTQPRYASGSSYAAAGTRYSTRGGSSGYGHGYGGYGQSSASTGFGSSGAYGYSSANSGYGHRRGGSYGQSSASSGYSSGGYGGYGGYGGSSYGHRRGGGGYAHSSASTGFGNYGRGRGGFGHSKASSGFGYSSAQSDFMLGTPQSSTTSDDVSTIPNPQCPTNYLISCELVKQEIPCGQAGTQYQAYSTSSKNEQVV